VSGTYARAAAASVIGVTGDGESSGNRESAPSSVDAACLAAVRQGEMQA